MNKGIEALGIGRLDIDEIERGRPRRQRGRELTAQVAVDFQDRDQKAEPKSERQHDSRRERARAVDIGNGESQDSRARTWDPGSHRHQEPSHEVKGEERHRGGRDKDQRDLAIVGGRDRERSQQSDRHDGGHHIAPPRPATLGSDLAAKQH